MLNTGNMKQYDNELSIKLSYFFGAEVIGNYGLTIDVNCMKMLETKNFKEHFTRTINRIAKNASPTDDFRSTFIVFSKTTI